MPEPLLPHDLLTPPASEPPRSIFSGNKGLIIAVAVVLLAVVIGFSVFVGFDASEQYKGMINKVKTETETLENSLR